MSDYSDAYQEHVLNAPDCCSNCYGLVRETAVCWVPTDQVNKASLQDRTVKVRTGKQRDLVLVEHMPSREAETEVGYVPSAQPADSKTIFCECGADSSFTRIWSPPETARQVELGLAWVDGESGPVPRTRALSDERFKGCLKRLIRVLECKDVSIARKPLVMTALDARKAGAWPDEALSRGLEAGIQHAEIRSRTGTSRASAD